MPRPQPRPSGSSGGTRRPRCGASGSSRRRGRRRGTASCTLVRSLSLALLSRLDELTSPPPTGYVYRPVRRAAKKPSPQGQLPSPTSLRPPPLSPTELPCVLQPVPVPLSPPRAAEPPLASTASPASRRPRLRADVTPHLRSTDLPTPAWQLSDLDQASPYFFPPSTAEPGAAPRGQAAEPDSSPWSAEDAADLALGVAALDAGGGSSWATTADSPDSQPTPSAFEAAFYPSPPPSTTLDGFDDAWLQSVLAQQEAIELPYQYQRTLPSSLPRPPSSR